MMRNVAWPRQWCRAGEIAAAERNAIKKKCGCVAAVTVPYQCCAVLCCVDGTMSYIHGGLVLLCWLPGLGGEEATVRCMYAFELVSGTKCMNRSIAVAGNVDDFGCFRSLASSLE